jgi:hypothetical protein
MEAKRNPAVGNGGASETFCLAAERSEDTTSPNLLQFAARSGDVSARALNAVIPAGAENKDLARTRAISRWPAHADLFARKCDVDRAEACLIAWAGLQRRAGRG